VSTITERVAAGAALLDERDPGWWREGITHAIDLDRLDMKRGSCCVLGQREGTGSPLAFLARKRKLRLSTSQAEENGFLSGSAVVEDEATEYATLTAEWARAIEARRTAVTS
jgi:hypothetical protein